MKTLTFTVMGYHEFEELVNKNVPEAKGKYEYAACEECGNDIDKAYVGVDGKLDPYDRKELANGNLQYRSWPLFNLLVEKGILQPGNYLIRVSW